MTHSVKRLPPPIDRWEEAGVITQRQIKHGYWAYTAAEDVAKGAIKGHPPKETFLGSQPLTRNEMAAILNRFVDHIDNILHLRQLIVTNLSLNYPRTILGQWVRLGRLAPSASEVTVL